MLDRLMARDIPIGAVDAVLAFDDAAGLADFGERFLPAILRIDRGGTHVIAVGDGLGRGIFSGADLAAQEMAWLAAHFGNSAEWLHNLARGIDHRRVKSNRPLKSLGGERTFFNELIADIEIR